MISTDEVEDVPAKVKEITGGKLAYAVRRCLVTYDVSTTHAIYQRPAPCTAADHVFGLYVSLRKERTRCLAC